MKVIFAQGNPGDKYARTRHNVGAVILDSFAAAQDASWKVSDKFNARIAEVSLHGEKVLLVFPLTYYNETGISARRIIDFYKLNAADDFLAIHDDLALPLGTIRTRAKGSDAGNNGVKSLNAHLGDNYHRIRIGIWNEDLSRGKDVDFVLGIFTKEEVESLEKSVIPKVHELIDAFAKGSFEITSHSLQS